MEKTARKTYLKKIARIRKGRFITVKDFAEQYGLR